MNRLGSASSAYLRSAAHQPVHWFPWGEEAFTRARETNRPVLLDIGAVWCHWCHVMDGESYEDPLLAEFLNRNFVAVKVDRDERPDVDARYQRAVQAFSGQGGWPLTAFLTPGGEAFYGGTYFPPEGKYQRPGFRTVLEQVLRIYQDQPDRVTAQSDAVRRLVAETLDESGPGQASEETLESAVQEMARVFDFANGGFGTAPKFPHPGAIELLLARWFDHPTPVIRTMVMAKMLGMAQGGIHDHLGGGFHRYSTDPRWIVPHFEKMSYDNSELLRAYLGAWSVFGEEVFRETARGIVRWIREVLADPEGGYGASQDADVGLDDDGDYFTWTREEAAQVLAPDELELVGEYYDIGTAGEMHHNPGKNVLFISGSLEDLAARLRRPVDDLVRILPPAVQKLREARARREAPFVDRTRYTSWNAMLAGALLLAGVALEDEWARDHALLTLGRIRGENPGDTVARTPGGQGGWLEDQVQVALAAIEAFEVTGDRAWLEWSMALMDAAWREYWDGEQGGFFDTQGSGPRHGLLDTRAKPIQDAPTPSANGVAGIVLARLAGHDDAPRWRERRDALVAAFAGAAVNLGVHGSTFLRAMDWSLHPATHLVVVGPRDDPEAERMHRRAVATWVPRRIVQRLVAGPEAGARAPAPVRAMLSGGTAAYLCIGTSCREPARTDREWSQRLAELQPALSG